jgi:BirA family biotin operon repressor/biotin-[acetyl-CoA-carboxylase] ligase
MSVVLRPVAPEPRWGWVPLLAGLAVAESLIGHGVPAVLKWPNDVVIDGPARDGGPGPRKLGGLLAERVERAIVVGIGVNVDLRADEVPVAHATSTWLEGAVVARETLVVEILSRIRERYTQWQLAAGDAERSGLAVAYSERCLTLGREVRASLPGDRVVTGTAYAIDDDGRLLLHLPDGSRSAVSAGDVELVR